ITPNPACPPPYEEVEFVNPPFSPLNPMGGSPTVSIDPVTGMLTGIPNLQGQFTVGVCIKEFRNGQLLSIVRRDFQFTVTECEPLVDASMGGLNVQPMSNGYRVTSCGRTDIQILNTSQDMNHIEEVVWRFNLPDTTLNASSWDLNMTFPGPGIYEGALLLNPGNIGCSDSTKVHLEIYPEIHPDFDYAYDTCVAGPVSFTNKSFIDEGGQIASFSWDFDDGTVDTANYHATHIYNEPGDHLVSLTIRDQNDCEMTKAETVSYNPVPALILVRPNDTVSCVPSEVFFNNLSTPIDDSYDIHWDFGDGETSGEISPVHTYRTAGIFDIRLEITSPIGCYTDTLFPALIEIQPPPVAGFYYAPEVLDNFNSDVAFFDASEYSVHWDWYIDGNLVAQKPDFEYS
ncbi:MAG: PKD domain-containing protein, partial [Bacteroidetes bacterium]